MGSGEGREQGAGEAGEAGEEELLILEPCPMPRAQFKNVKQYFDNLRYNATHLLIVSCHVLMTNDK